jgi:hypothetical protein
LTKLKKLWVDDGLGLLFENMKKFSIDFIGKKTDFTQLMRNAIDEIKIMFEGVINYEKVIEKTGSKLEQSDKIRLNNNNNDIDELNNGK